jgi:hypothetical protein
MPDGGRDNDLHERVAGSMSADETASGRRELDRVVGRLRAELGDWASATEDDAGVALVELLALVGDLLGARADAVAEEAYLGGSGGPRASGRRRRPGLALAVEVEVEVDGRRWQQVEDLGASAPEDSHYRVTQGEDGATVVQFGDGVHGRRPPEGSSIGVYHRGSGRLSGVLVEPGRVVVDLDRAEPPAIEACGVYRATVVGNVDPLMRRRLQVRVPALLGDAVLWAMACLPAGGTDEVPAVGDGAWVAFEAGDPHAPVWMGRIVSF